MKLVIYETTHHENLPALLDLAESRFEEVTVFLKKSTYHSICGKGDPVSFWPRTVFLLQEEDCGNRVFIRKMFRHIREKRASHLHLATLDNNLLFFAWMIRAFKTVHISLTVHEIYEYHANRYGDLRDWTETLAKLYLRRRIRHTHFFLPAMVELFRQKYPALTAVWIPSRFYSRSPESEKNLESAPERPFKIVIPGSVESNRRDYASVAEFLDYFLSQGNEAGQEGEGVAIELVILGNSGTPYGTAVVEDLQRRSSPHWRLIFYMDHIPQDEYERQLAEANVLWSPLRLQKRGIRKVPEIAGRSTASGLTADLLLNNTPALVPAGYTIPEKFREAIFPYRDKEELLSFLNRLMKDPAWYRACKKNIDASFSFFSVGNFKEAFGQLMGE